MRLCWVVTKTLYRWAVFTLLDGHWTGRRRRRVSSNDLLNFWLSELCCWYDDDRRQRGRRRKKLWRAKSPSSYEFSCREQQREGKSHRKEREKVEGSWDDDDDGDIVYVEDGNWVSRALLQCNSFHLEMEIQWKISIFIIIITAWWCQHESRAVTHICFSTSPYN